MSAKLMAMAGIAIVVGGGTMFGANNWLGSQQATLQSEAERLRLEAAKLSNKPKQTFETTKVLVAAQPLVFGDELNGKNIKAVDWPAKFTPKGSFQSVEKFLEETRRVALAPMQVDEPILDAKVTGEGQRPTLSKILPDGKHAITINVNAVAGVAGFVLPGDRVDILLTKNAENESFSEILLQNIRVLSIDQIANEAKESSTLAKTVTFEVDLKQAQRIRLGNTKGTLSLLLRKAGEETNFETSRMSSAELFDGSQGAEKPNPDSTLNTTVVVTRALAGSEYSVPASK